MITKYITYIKENKDISVIENIYNTLKDLYKFDLVTLELTHTVVGDTISLINNINDSVIIFIIYCNDLINYRVNNEFVRYFKLTEIDYMIKYYKTYIDTYYKNLHYTNTLYVLSLPIFNLQEYLLFIIKYLDYRKYTIADFYRSMRQLYINKDSRYVYDTIKNYFDENYDNYKNAKNFDLI